MKFNNKKTMFGVEIPDLPYWDLEGKYTNSWVEDSFLFSQKIGRQIPIPESKTYMGHNFFKKKRNIMLVIVGVIFFVLMGRVSLLQVFNGNNYLALAESNRQRTIPIPSERGIIYDRNGVELTKNIPKFSLAIIPQDLPKDKEELSLIIKKLAVLTNQDENFISETIKEYGAYSYESIDILDDLDYETAIAIQIETNDLPGIHIQRGSKRLYLNNIEMSSNNSEAEKVLSLSHILGYSGKLNPDELKSLYSKGYLPTGYIGKTGIEKTYETILRGQYGYQRVEVDALGKKQSVLSENPPQHGSHIKLTIDYYLQKKLEEIMTSVLAKNKKTKAAAVAINPQNGEILAMVSLPAFDNNDFSGGIDREKYANYISNPDKPLFNRAISGTYPSGSTIKIGVALAALQEGIISANTSFLSNGGLRIGSWFFKDWSAGGHGVTNVRKALAWSVNTFFYYIGGGYGDFVGLGSDKITEYLNKFGLAQKLGIDLPGEAEGFLPDKNWKETVKKEKWYVGDTYNLSIGQGDVLVTPLQIANLTATIANGGTMYQPRLLREIIDPATEKVERQKPIILNANIAQWENVKTIKAGMRDCTLYGSCRSLLAMPINIAGKTGTAQWKEGKETHSWFTSFAPYESPEIALTVIVEEGGEGSGLALQIAREFYSWWAMRRQ